MCNFAVLHQTNWINLELGLKHGGDVLTNNLLSNTSCADTELHSGTSTNEVKIRRNGTFFRGIFIITFTMHDLFDCTTLWSDRFLNFRYLSKNVWMSRRVLNVNWLRMFVSSSRDHLFCVFYLPCSGFIILKH